MVSLLECELRSNAMKTMTVPTIRMAKPTIRVGHFSDFILACSDYFDSSEPLDETVAETRDVMLRQNQKSYGVFVVGRDLDRDLGGGRLPPGSGRMS